MINENNFEFLKNRPKFFVDLIFKWYPINSTILFKMLNSDLSHYIEHLSYSKLCKNENIFKDSVLFEIILGYNLARELIPNHLIYKLPNETIKKLGENGVFIDFQVTNRTDLTDDFINDLRIERQLYEKFQNEDYKWTIEEIDKYHSNKGFSFYQLSQNQGAFWTKELIIKYKQNWSWERLSRNPSLPWDLELISLFEFNWDWELLSENPALPWDLELISLFEFKWDWRSLSRNPSLPWNWLLIKEYEDLWNWNYLFSNFKDFDEESIEQYKNKSEYCFGYLSRNTGTFWSKELIGKYKEEWNWQELSGNPSIPCDEDFLDTFQDELSWSSLLKNKNIQWTPNFIDKCFNEYWGRSSDFKISARDLLKIKNLPWTIELIEKYKNKLGITDWEIDTIWKLINENKNFKWIDKISPELNKLTNQGRVPFFDIIYKKIRIFYQLNGTKENDSITVENFRFELTNSYTKDFTMKMPWDKRIINYLTNELQFWASCQYWYHVKNDYIPWSIEILDEFEFYWSWEDIIESEKIWNILFRDIINEEMILRIISEFEKKEEFSNYTFYFPEKPICYEKKSEIDYKNYGTKRVIDIYKINPKYIGYLLDSSKPFYMSENDLKELEQISEYKFSESALKMAYKKMMYVKRFELDKNYFDQERDRN